MQHKEVLIFFIKDILSVKAKFSKSLNKTSIQLVSRYTPKSYSTHDEGPAKW